MADRLFVYGTLRPDRAPAEIVDIVAQFHRLGEGTVHGRLYDLGDYPGIVLDPKAGQVKGEIFAIPQSPGALARLDAYEEYHPAARRESLFLRRKTTVTLTNGTQSQCWVYVYNKPIPAHQRESQLASVA